MKYIILATLLLFSCNKEDSSNKLSDAEILNGQWSDIVNEARGQTVYWHGYGGSLTTNKLVDDVIIPIAKDEYGITLERVGINDVGEAVNRVLAEKRAGKLSKGAVDLLWINAANFLKLRDGESLFSGWSQNLPNARYLDLNNTAISHDAGNLIAGDESPWATTVAMTIYDSERTDVKTLPTTFSEIVAWAKAHPGRYTFIGPPQFYGVRQIKEWMYEVTQGAVFDLDFESTSKDDFYQMTKEVWDGIAEMRPYLWMEGMTFPRDTATLNKLFRNNEIDMSYIFSGYGIKGALENNSLPPTAKVFLKKTSIADANFVAIPFNSSNKAASMVVANILLRPEVQIKAIEINQNGLVLDTAAFNEEQRQLLAEAIATLPAGSYVTEAEKKASQVPEFNSVFNQYIIEIWNDLFQN